MPHIDWCLSQIGVIEGFDDEDGHQNKETFSNKGIAMFNGDLSANLPTHQIGAGHQQAKLPVKVAEVEKDTQCA